MTTNVTPIKSIDIEDDIEKHIASYNFPSPPPLPAEHNIARITADAVRVSGEKVVADLLEVAREARETADTIENEATQLATNIREATSGVADRLTAYIESCQRAALSFRDHREKLIQLPTLPELIDESKAAELGKKMESAINGNET